MGLWGPVKKALNNDIDIPLNELIRNSAFDAISINKVHGGEAFTTAGTHTWTCPDGVYFVLVFLGSGGGGGASGSAGNSGSTSSKGGSGAGGEGGNILIALVKVESGVTYNIVVGKGGTGGAKPTANATVGNAGNRGGTTSFGGLVSAIGGEGGNAPSSYTKGGNGGSTTLEELLNGSGVTFETTDVQIMYLQSGDNGNAGTDGGSTYAVGSTGGGTTTVLDADFPEFTGFTVVGTGGSGGDGGAAASDADAGSAGAKGNAFLKW